MDITAVIRELLFGHDCVIVPGFGGFIGNYTPARIEKETGTFYPPLKQISFNRNLNHNDGLLVGKISGFSTITYGDARVLVEEFVADIRDKLGRGENVVFDHIGSFINNQEGNVQFEPDRSANYYLDSYGLETFNLQPIEGYDIRKRILMHTGSDPVRRTFSSKLLWRAAVIVPLLSVMVAVSLKSDLLKGKVESTTLNPLVKTELEHIKNIPAETISEAVVENKDLSEPVTPEPLSSEVPVPVATAEYNYSLITGSFKAENNAVSQADMLRADGFEPEIIVAPNGFYRVSAMTSGDLNLAKIKRDSISKKYPGTWVSRKK